MNDRILGLDLSVSCKDGTVHDGVSLRIENGYRVFESADGQRLDVAAIQGGAIAASPLEYAIICRRYPILTN